MISLRELQRTMRAAIVADDAVVPIFVAGSTEAGSTEAGAAARVGIYREAYRLRLAEALGDSYPALRALLGDTQFHDLTRAHLRRHPSRHFSIRWFGERLPTWLARTAPYAAQPALAELARFEWALTLAFDAADAAALDATALSSVPSRAWPAQRFMFHPSLLLVTMRWNVVAMWRALAGRDDDQDPVAPPAATRLPKPVTYAVWRRDLAVRFDALEADELRALRAAKRRRTFAELCEHAPATLDDSAAAAWAATLIARWFQRGWVTAVSPEMTLAE